MILLILRRNLNMTHQWKCLSTRPTKYANLKWPNCAWMLQVFVQHDSTMRWLPDTPFLRGLWTKKALKSSLIFCSITHLKTVKVSFAQIKFIYSEKATKFYEIFTFLLSYVVPVKRWRFCKILWFSQNIWTLTKTNIAIW